MKLNARSRALAACGVLAVCFTAFSWRLVHVQVRRHDHYRTEAMKKNTRKVEIAARRGTITDARGEPLAQNEPISRIIADASRIKDRDRDATIEVISQVLKIPQDEVRTQLARQTDGTGKKEPMRYILLKRRVPEAVKNELERQLSARELRGVYSELEESRIYPNARLACHVVGFSNGSVGVGGIEQSFDDKLSGVAGYRVAAIDGSGRELPQYRGFEREPRNGNNVQITIDLGLQNIVEMELDAACRKFRPKSASVILMEPRTGVIMAMANRPNFDLNDLNRGTEEQQRNRAIECLYEPGSTFKVVTVAGALERGTASLDSMYFCENGYYAPYRLKDHAAYRDLSVKDILIHSSNIGVAKLAIQMGDRNFYDCVRRFGFGEPTGISLPAEARGSVQLPHTWDKLTETRMAMGHAVDVTPLQIAAAISAIANGGKLMLPQIVSQVTDDHGRVLSTFPPQEVRTVCRPSVARGVRDAMIEVCTKRGTAPDARVMGYKVAGKTGTAQKPDGHGGYMRDKWVVSFAGFMPALDPAFVAVVVIDEAKTSRGQNYGGLVAAPVFAEIAKKIAVYLGLPPTEVRAQGETGGVFAREGRGAIAP